MNYRLFIVVGCALPVVLVSYGILARLDNLFSAMSGNGLSILLMMCYIFISLIVLTSFIGKNLKALEMGNDVDINDYINDILSLIFWPIGIWMFQPRINNLERRISAHVVGESTTNTVVASQQSGDVRRSLEARTINRMIGYGVLVFLIGFFIGVHWIKYVQLLIPIGSLMAFCGVFFFFKETNLEEEFAMDPKDDVLTYFGDVILLKFWTFIILIWMIVMNLVLVTKGWQ
jgi:hypothetical protein